MIIAATLAALAALGFSTTVAAVAALTARAARLPLTLTVAAVITTGVLIQVSDAIMGVAALAGLLAVGVGVSAALYTIARIHPTATQETR